MALMNRFHQIEQTLIKNLEDNWEDRDKVEFVLMDLSSKDGFRRWIREQDLSKYTESGYLRYYETGVLDTWHQSVGKNTAIHQAYGEIVVTLDCDNFTGYRGGQFLINLFEKHENNCVVHQYDGNPQNGNFGRISMTKKSLMKSEVMISHFYLWVIKIGILSNEPKQLDVNTLMHLTLNLIVLYITMEEKS